MNPGSKFGYAIVATFAICLCLQNACAAVVAWTNAAGGNWSVAANWSPNGVPASGDTVFITNAGNYTVTVDVSPTLSGFTFGADSGTQSLSHAANTLTLNGPSELGTNSTYLLSGGTLAGSGIITFKGTLNWTAGTMSGVGSSIFDSVATVNFFTANNKFWRQRTVDNYTLVSYTGGGLLADIGGVWNNMANGTFTITGDFGIAYGGAGGYATINNFGTFRKNAGSGVASVQVTINNSGYVQAHAGFLSLDGGGSSSGWFQANVGCTNNFGQLTHTLISGATFDGAGLFKVSQYSGASSLAIAAPLTITNRFELNVGGEITGTNTVIFAGPFTWVGGTMTTASGKTVFTNSATVNLFSASDKHLASRTVDNHTTVNYSGSGLRAGIPAVWNNQAGSVFDLQTDSGIVFNGSANYATFNNAGLLKKSNGTGASSLQLAVNNSGTVQALSGNLSLDTGGVSSGEFFANAGCTNQFGGLTHTLVGGVAFTGAGHIRATASYINPASLNIATLLTISRSFELNFGGEITGTNTVIFAGPFTWVGGTMTTASGKTVFTNSATVNLFSASDKHLASRTVDNHTTVNYSGSGLRAGIPAVWNNQPGSLFDLQTDSGITFNGSANYATFNNAGLLKKSSGTGTSSLQLAVNNSGTVQALSGTLSLDTGGVSSGEFFANAGCTNQFGGLTHTLVGGVAFTGAGHIRATASYINPASLNIATLLTISRSFELNFGGEITGTNTVIFAGPFTWVGGTMTTAAGRTVFTNSATVNLISASDKNHAGRTVDNYTTVTYSGSGLRAGIPSVWNNQPGSLFDLQTDSGIVFNGAANYATFNNAGTLRKSGGTGTSSLQLAVNNSGTVQALSGTLSLDTGGVSSGEFFANAGCTNQFGGLTHTLVGGVAFTGAGHIRATASYINPASLNIATLLTISRSFELNFGGEITGTNTVIFAGPFTWVGGTMTTASGKTVFTNSATVNLISASDKNHAGRTVDNYTTVNYSGSGLRAGIPSVWNNQPGSIFDLQTDNGIAFNGSANYATFNNAGTLKKSGGTALANVAMFVRNTSATSVVRSQSGILGFSVSYIQTNGLTELAGGNFAGALFDLRGGLLTGAGNIAANVLNNGHIAPGSGVGLITISNNVAQTYSANSGMVTFEIGGVAPVTGHDQIRLNNGNATLSGTLRAQLANSHIPSSGNTYTVMTFTARSGVFTNFVFPDYEFGVVHTTTNVILIASNALPAIALSGVPSNQLVCVPFRFTAGASDLDGTVTNLTVLHGTNVLGTWTNGNLRNLVFTYDYPDAAVLTARAHDNKGGIRETNVTTSYYTLPLHVLNLGGVVTNGSASFKFCMLGESGSNYNVVASTTVETPLAGWTSIGAMQETNGIFRYLDIGATTNQVWRFYRALQSP